jgi:hypothetical protein
MFGLMKFFLQPNKARLRKQQEPGSEYGPPEEGANGFEIEYQRLISAEFRLWKIAPHHISIEVRQMGTAADGYDVFVGMIRLIHWDRHAVLRILLGLPILEGKVREAVRRTWLADHTHFVGLWLHSSEHLKATPAMTELNELVMELAPPLSRSKSFPRPVVLPSPAFASTGAGRRSVEDVVKHPTVSAVF